MSQVLLRFLVSPCRVNLAWLPTVICLGGFLIIQIKYFPGLVGTDQFCQLNQIEEGVITDWHSPVMTYTWKLIRDGYKIITGTTIIGNGILWTLYNLQLWIGFFLVLRSNHFLSNKAKYKSCFFVVLLLLASLWLFRDLSIAANSLGKDLGFLGAYLMATGLLLNFPKNKQYQLLFAFGVLFFLFYGTAMRHNAVFAVVPLLCWFVWAMLPKKNLLMIISIGFVLWVIMLTGLHCVNYKLIKAERLYSLSEILFLDIWHLNARTSNYILPPNTFGNNFTDLNEKTFRANFDKDWLWMTPAFSKINGDNPERFRFGNGSLTLSRTPDKDKLMERVNRRKTFFDSMVPVNKRKAFFDRWRVASYKLTLQEVQTQIPKDYQLLKKAWINRILMDPIPYLKFKVQFFSQLCGLDIQFCRLNAKKLFVILFLMLMSLFVSQSITSQAVFPWLMLTLSALFYILPLWLFCPDSTQIRYLYWFFAASFISIAYFLAHSPLFAAIMQTIQQYLEEKVLSKRLSSTDVDGMSGNSIMW